MDNKDFEYFRTYSFRNTKKLSKEQGMEYFDQFIEWLRNNKNGDYSVAFEYSEPNRIEITRSQAIKAFKLNAPLIKKMKEGRLVPMFVVQFTDKEISILANSLENSFGTVKFTSCKIPYTKLSKFLSSAKFNVLSDGGIQFGVIGSSMSLPPEACLFSYRDLEYLASETESFIKIKEDIKVPGTNLILEKGDRIYVREAMKAGLNCSNVQSIRTPRLKYDMNVKYGKMQPHEAPEELDKIVRNAGFYHDTVGDPSYVKFMRAKGYDQWVLYYLGQGRDFRLQGDNGDDFILTLR